eukprot:NODE_15447_length_1049_cov_9.241866.p2 GENE.NODE_15447_length_1049_cov_9.241866~~NODE_15447_length_1049_cov_9.241866.p2  ORF type:complete len:270 (-),score=86.39 NODE_15447_length_1049_cov_9.241866:161-970(-)
MAIVPTRSAWDPAALSEGTDVGGDATARDRRAHVAHGAVAFGAALEKVAPEIFTQYMWIGSTGSSTTTGARDIYKVVPYGEESKPKDGGKKKKEAEQGGQIDMFKKPHKLFNPKEFSWTRILHPLLGEVLGMQTGGFLTETAFTPTALRLYTDHRVMGQIVIPGVSHCAYFAATAISGFSRIETKSGRPEEECGVVKEVLFERPYVLHRGFAVLMNRGHGDDLDHGIPVVAGFGSGDETGDIVTYCRSGHVSRQFKSPKKDMFTGAADH